MIKFIKNFFIKYTFLKKILNFFSTIIESNKNHGFVKFITRTLSPTIDFFKYISKYLLNPIINFFKTRISKPIAVKVFSYAVLVGLIFFTAFIPSLYKVTNNVKNVNENNLIREFGNNDPTIDQILKRSLFKDESRKLSIDYQQVLNLMNLFEKSGYNLDRVRDGGPVSNFFLAKFPEGITELDNLEQRKRIFIQILLPVVLSENEKIRTNRRKLTSIMNLKSYDKESLWLKEQFDKYKVKDNNYKELLKRMDVIPPSLALAQAAYESAWGTSRFAIEGNALFGQWTWKENTGIVPERRPENEKYEVSKFNLIRSAVTAYKNNLNSHPFYEDFRRERAKVRMLNPFGSISGYRLVDHLGRYSIRGQDYVVSIKKVIEQNSLYDFDKSILTPKRSSSI